MTGVENRPVLAIGIDRGVTAGRAHGEQHQRPPLHSTSTEYSVALKPSVHAP